MAATSSSTIAKVVLPASKSGNSSDMPGPAWPGSVCWPRRRRRHSAPLPIIEMAPRSQMTSFSEPRGVVKQ